jgi:hypothetical protein
VVATEPTEDTVPGVLDPSGRVTLTASPTLTSLCWAASSGIVTKCWSEVAVSTDPDAGAPRLPATVATRSPVGSNTNDPSESDPEGLAIPNSACSFCTPVCVAEEKVSQPAALSCTPEASPSATKSWLSWDTSVPVAPESSARHAGTLPYSSTVGEPLSVLNNTWP